MEARANQLCKLYNNNNNDNNTETKYVKIRRTVMILGYNNGKFIHDIKPTVSHIWICNNSNNNNIVHHNYNDNNVITPQSDKIVGIAQWDVRVNRLLSGTNRGNKVKNSKSTNGDIFVWNLDNLPYYESSQMMGTVACLNYFHLIPGMWHSPECDKLLNLFVYLKKNKHLNYNQLPKWAQNMLGKRGRIFYHPSLMTSVKFLDREHKDSDIPSQQETVLG